jgi:hypothetical protein
MKSEPAAPRPDRSMRCFVSLMFQTLNGLTRLRSPASANSQVRYRLLINSQAVYRPSLVENSRVTMSSVEQ